MRTAVVLLSLIVALTSPARAEMTPEEFLTLVEAYQEGFLRVSAATAFQLYASTGIVATAFQTGQLDGPEALEALGENRLLHSVTYEALLKVKQNTPREDTFARAEIDRLARLLVLEDELLKALADVFSQPTDSRAQRVEQARQRVATALDEYLALGEDNGT